MGRLCRAVVLVELLVAIGASDLAAQSVTTAALYGVVRGSDSGGIADAVVTVTNTADGGRWRTTTRADGRYAFEYLSVGGPYTIEARAIGFRSGRADRAHALARRAAPGRHRRWRRPSSSSPSSPSQAPEPG